MILEPISKGLILADLGVVLNCDGIGIARLDIGQNGTF